MGWKYEFDKWLGDTLEHSKPELLTKIIARDAFRGGWETHADQMYKNPPALVSVFGYTMSQIEDMKNFALEHGWKPQEQT